MQIQHNLFENVSVTAASESKRQLIIEILDIHGLILDMPWTQTDFFPTSQINSCFFFVKFTKLRRHKVAYSLFC